MSSEPNAPGAPQFPPGSPFEDFFNDFLDGYQSNKDSNFRNDWQLEFEKSEENHLQFLSSSQWSDLKAHYLIQKQLNGKKVKKTLLREPYFRCIPSAKSELIRVKL